MQQNGWQLFYFRLFKAALDELEAEVTRLAKQDPAGYKTHPKTRLLASREVELHALMGAIPAAIAVDSELSLIHFGQLNRGNA